MRFFILFTFIFYTLSVFPSSLAPLTICDFKSSTFKGQECLITDLNLLHPTQFAVGRFAVLHKKRSLELKYLYGTFEKYLNKRPVPVLIGPDEKLYLVDKHHMALALIISGVPPRKKYLKVKVLSSWLGRSMSDFNSMLVKNNYVYLKENNSEKMKNVEDLPETLIELEDDPYRSLSWLVRESGGYHKVDVNFLEFMWGAYFYKHGVKLMSDNIESLKTALDKAMLLTDCDKSNNLPGCLDD